MVVPKSNAPTEGASLAGTLAQLADDYLGPALCLHVHRTRKYAFNDDVEALYFLARDGHLLMRIHERLGAIAGAPAMRAIYLHVSRRSLARSAIIGSGAAEDAASSRRVMVYLESMGLTKIARAG